VVEEDFVAGITGFIMQGNNGYSSICSKALGVAVFVVWARSCVEPNIIALTRHTHCGDLPGPSLQGTTVALCAYKDAEARS